MFPTSQVLKFPKSEILAGDHAKEFCFACGGNVKKFLGGGVIQVSNLLQINKVIQNKTGLTRK